VTHHGFFGMPFFQNYTASFLNKPTGQLKKYLCDYQNQKLGDIRYPKKFELLSPAETSINSFIFSVASKYSFLFFGQATLN